MATLRELGLSDYEVRTYHELLEKGGQATAQEITEQADVPDGRVYDVLNSLAQYGLVQPCEPRQPKTYTPVEPAIALNRLLEAKQAQLERTRQHYEDLVNEVADELTHIGSVQHLHETATISREEMARILTDHLATATQEVLLTIAAPSPTQLLEGEPGLYEALSDAIQSGADVSVLVHPEHALVEEGPGQMPAVGQRALDIRVCDQVTKTAACLDGETLVTECPTVFQQPLGALLLNDCRPEVVDWFRKPFRRRWEQTYTVPLDSLQAAE